MFTFEQKKIKFIMRLTTIIISIPPFIPVIVAHQSWRPQPYLDFRAYHHSPRWQPPRGGGDIIENEVCDLSLQNAVISTDNEGQNSQSSHAETVSLEKSTGVNPIHHKEDLAAFSPSSPSAKSDFFHHHPFYARHLTRNEEKAILGRAVLTTPHRRMPAIRISPGPRPPFLSEF
jgi:hypothetical protein